MPPSQERCSRHSERRHVHENWWQFRASSVPPAQRVFRQHNAQVWSCVFPSVATLGRWLVGMDHRWAGAQTHIRLACWCCTDCQKVKVPAQIFPSPPPWGGFPGVLGTAANMSTSPPPTDDEVGNVGVLPSHASITWPSPLSLTASNTGDTVYFSSCCAQASSSSDS